MTDSEDLTFYLCPDCLTPSESSEPCVNCGATVMECRPGGKDDPCRRPIVDAGGNVRTRAPLWWLKHRIGELTKYYE